MRKRIATDAAPKAIGPYSQGIDTGDLVFISRQVGIEGIERRTEQALWNVGAILQAAGVGWGNVVKTTLWLTDVAHFTKVNEIYTRHIVEPAPARSAPIVAALLSHLRRGHPETATSVSGSVRT